MTMCSTCQDYIPAFDGIDTCRNHFCPHRPPSPEFFEEEASLPNPCPACMGAGKVWARHHALPKGFHLFAGGALERTADRQHVAITCPTCDGSGEAKEPVQ